jgi:hypothetical protein
MLAGGFCGEAAAEAAAGAVAGVVAAFGPTAGEAGFPQETRVIAPNKKVDSCHKWKREYRLKNILFSIVLIVTF